MTAEEAPGQQRPRSPLEDLVFGLENDLEAHTNEPGLYTVEWLCNRIAIVVEFHVTEADRRAYGALPTPEERARKVIGGEPYRTQLRRIDTEVHSKEHRWRKRRLVLGPVLERAARESIRELAALCDKRRRVSQ